MTHAYDASWMVGRRIERVELFEPSQWRFGLGAEIGIGVECPWRLRKDGRIAISSEDHMQKYGLPKPLDAVAVAGDLFAANSIVRVDICDGSTDLLIGLTGGLQFEVLPISSGYESWNIFGPSGIQVIAQGGGELCVWNR